MKKWTEEMIKEKYGEVRATNQVNYPVMALVYEADSDYVVASIGSCFTDSSWYVGTTKPRTYKVYTDKEDRYYFKKDNNKFYLDETLRRFF